MKLLAMLCALPLSMSASAQTLPGTYKCSWVGNTFGDGLTPNRQSGHWVQNDVLAATMSGNGTIYTNSEWDEGGRQAGIYTATQVIGNLSTGAYVPNVGKVGKEYSAKGWAVAVNSNNAFATYGGSIFKYHLNGSGGTSFANCKAYGLSADNNVIAASDNEANQVRLYNTSGGQIRSWAVTKPGPIAVAPNGDIWVVTCMGRGGDKDKKFWTFGQNGTTKVQHYSSTGTFINEISDPQGNNSWKPTCLGFHKDGRLMIGDAGLRSQILFYQVAGTPSLNATFGDNGGLGAGSPGQATPRKFWGITGVGCDSNGNIMVAMHERGAAIRTFDAAGNMIGALYGLHFVDCVDVDPASDGTQIYGINEHISLDLGKTTPGTEWSLAGITYHKNAYPTDPRGTRNVLDMASTFMRRVNGNLLMFTTGMYAGTLDVYRFQGELAIFCQTFGLGTSAYEPDVDGNIWYYANNRVRKFPLNGFTSGIPNFGGSQDIAAKPSGVGSVERLYYNKAKDEMYFTGETPAGDWGVIGSKISKYTQWSGAKNLAWKVDLPYGPGTPGTNRQKAISFTDDYFFTVGVVVRCKVNVFSTSTGAKVGEMLPGPEVNGLDSTGWVDIPYGIRSFKRSNGEYLVFVEEDAFGKTLMFRWTPVTSNIPTAPSGPAAAAISASQINLSWVDNSNNETGFKIERKAGTGGVYAPVVTTAAGATSYSDTGLTEGTQYFYRIRATNANGDSPYTPEVSATPILGSAKDILSFTFGTLGPTTISGTDIVMSVPMATDVSALAPTYTFSPTATGDATFPSGSTRDFTSSKTYTITAQNGSTKTYTVTVNIRNSFTFDFQDGTLQGWHNRVWNSSTSAWVDLDPNVTTMPSTINGGVIQPPSVDNHLYGIVSNVVEPIGGQKDNHLNTLWLRSPQFHLNGTGDLTAQLARGIARSTEPANDASVPSAAISNGGWMGLALRRASDGVFLLSKSRPSPEGNGLLTVTFTAAELAPYLGIACTLDLINADRGNWGWQTMDNVSIPGSTTPVDPFMAWINTSHPTLSDKTPDGDPDGDGVSNQSEFAFGLDPSKATSANPITTQLDRTTGIFSYTRRATPVQTGLTYTVWTSPGLQTWTWDAGAIQTAGTPVAGVEPVSVKLSDIVPLSTPTLFVRVKAQ